MKELVWEFEEEEVKQESIIKYYSNGKKWTKCWYLNGVPHREDGPAFIAWSMRGHIMIESWFLNGKRISRNGKKKKTTDERTHMGI